HHSLILSERNLQQGGLCAGVSVESGVGRAPMPTLRAATRCPSPVATRSRVLQNLVAAVELARAVAGQRDRRAVIDDLEVGDLERGEVAGAEQPAPLRGRVAIALRGQRDVATVGVVHA